MARDKPHKLCPECDRVLGGCSCGHRKAADGTMVHRGCVSKYNHRLELLKKQDEQENKKQ